MKLTVHWCLQARDLYKGASVNDKIYPETRGYSGRQWERGKQKEQTQMKEAAKLVVKTTDDLVTECEDIKSNKAGSQFCITLQMCTITAPSINR